MNEAITTVYRRVCGLDVHKKTVVACVRMLDEQGQVSSRVRSFGTMTGDLLKLGEWLQESGVTHVAMESTGVYWKPVYNLLEGSFEVLLVNAQHIKQVPGRKTDVKVLEDANIKLAAVASDVLGVSGRQMLEAIIAKEENPEVLADLAKRRLRAKIPQLQLALEGRVRDHHRFLLEDLLTQLDFLDGRIAAVSKRIEEVMPPPFARAVETLIEVPGLHHRTTQCVLAEIGMRMEQFPSAAHLASWAGVSPGSNESAGKRKSGKTTKGNRWLRAALGEAAWAAAHSKGTYFNAQFRRIAARRGPKRAAVAVQHSLLTIVYHLLRDGLVYQDLGPKHFERLNSDRLRRHHIAKLEALGFKVTIQPLAEVA